MSEQKMLAKLRDQVLLNRLKLINVHYRRINNRSHSCTHIHRLSYNTPGDVQKKYRDISWLEVGFDLCDWEEEIRMVCDYDLLTKISDDSPVPTFLDVMKGECRGCKRKYQFNKHVVCDDCLPYFKSYYPEMFENTLTSLAMIAVIINSPLPRDSEFYFIKEKTKMSILHCICSTYLDAFNISQNDENLEQCREVKLFNDKMNKKYKDVYRVISRKPYCFVQLRCEDDKNTLQLIEEKEPVIQLDNPHEG